MNSTTRVEPRGGAPSLRRDHVTLGIVYMLGATVMFAISSALSKWLITSYSIGQVLFVRTAISLIIMAAFILPTTGLAVYRTNRLGTHLSRMAAQATAQICLIIAFSMMPLAAGVAVNFSAPLFAALVAALFLRERVGGARWMALIVGFAGVLIVAGLSADTFQLGAVFALTNAMLYGGVTAAVRGMTTTESANTLLMWQMATIAAFHSLLLLFGFHWPAPIDAALLLLSGVANAAGQYFWTRALQWAPATAVSPFYYLMLVWAMIIGFLVWGDVPTAGLLAGSGIVVASGLFLLWHEGQRHRSAAPSGVGESKAGAKG